MIKGDTINWVRILVSFISVYLLPVGTLNSTILPPGPSP